jgi:hypothetical protein
MTWTAHSILQFPKSFDSRELNRCANYTTRTKHTLTRYLRSIFRVRNESQENILEIYLSMNRRGKPSPVFSSSFQHSMKEESLVLAG